MASGQPSVIAEASSAALEAQLQRVRLESDTLYRIVRVIAGSAEVPQVLAGIVDLLTGATNCHACFIYLREGDQLRLRGASGRFSQLIDQIQIPADKGLVGWSMRNQQPALARDDALHDPRFFFVPELEEESFQSMAAIAIPARQGPPIGAISVHTKAPHEFDDEIVTFLVHTASLLAGAIETAQLYEEASHRIETLTAIGRISERIAAIDSREQLYETVVAGVGELLSCDRAELFELDSATDELELVATAVGRSQAARGTGSEPAEGQLEEMTATIVAGDEPMGELRALVRSTSASPDHRELLGALANQTAVALKRAELIERLTDEYVTRDLFEALLEGEHERARLAARKLRLDLDADHLVVRAVATGDDPSWPERSERLELDLRELGLHAVADTSRESLTALISVGSRSIGVVEMSLQHLARRHDVIIGVAGAHRGPQGLVDALAEANDAASVGTRIGGSPGATFYRDLGVYRYLVRLPADRVPRDRWWSDLEVLRTYDDQRKTHLIETLERYLEQRGSITGASELLHVHPNTVRQRLDRIEDLTSIDLGSDELLALEVALKLFRISQS